MKQSIKLLTSIFIIALSSNSYAENQHNASHAGHEINMNAPAVHIKLSPEVAELLAQEMRELQSGMKELLPAIAAGKWGEIASIGEQMKNSYIMKKSLTREQMHELHQSLPADFQELDHSFHNSAGLLAQAASQENKEQVGHYYLKMTEACVNCHTLYAAHKFPELLK